MRSQMVRAFAKTVLVLGFAGVAAGVGIMPANAFTIDAHGVHVHAGPHRYHYWGPRYRDGEHDYSDYYDYAPCPRGFTVQDGVCKSYRGY